MYDIEKYYNAGTVSEAVTLLNEHPDTRIISGGSDVLIKIREGRMAGTNHFVAALPHRRPLRVLRRWLCEPVSRYVPVIAQINT